MPDTPPLPEAEQKRIALKLILEVWEKALSEGVSVEMIASSAIFAALTDMVEHYGSDAVAAMVAEWPERILTGEFTLTEEQPAP